MRVIRWMFSRSRLTPADIFVWAACFIQYHDGILSWWAAGLIVVVWIFISVLIEMLLFGDSLAP